MDENQGFSKEDLARYERMLDAQKNATSNLAEYYKTMQNLADTQRSLNHLQKTSLSIEEKIKTLKQKEQHLDGDALRDIQKEIALQEYSLALAKEKMKDAQMLTRVLSEALNKTKLLGAATGTVVAGLQMAAKTSLNQLGYLLEQQKAVKVAGFNMGVLSKQAESFKATLYQASLSTNAIGVDTKMLAEMQANYSEGIGRAVVLNENGLKAMAAMAKGTVLGAEGAADLAESMDNFNISAKSSKEIVEVMLNDAHKMGVNGAKSTKMMLNNIKMANKYHFKEGINGLAKMVNLATKYKLNIESIAGFAEKVFDVEGAVEMSAQLQVLGGNWSALGDPFELMYKARNDMEGFTKDIIKAAEVTGMFNKETGEIQLSALEMHRLREVAKATGVEYETLADAVGEVNKNTAKTKQARGFLGTKEDLEYLNALATFDKKKKKFVVHVDGIDYAYDNLSALNKNIVEKLKNEKETLEERAKGAQTFDDTWKNIVNTLKSAILPGFESFSSALSKGLIGFQTWMVDNKITEKLQAFGTFLGEKAAWLVQKLFEWPKLSASIIGGALLAKEAAWLLRGRMLGLGFNSVANVGGLGSSSSIDGGRFQGGSPMNKKMMRGMKGGGIAAGAGILGGMATDAGLFGEEGSTGHKVGGVASSALQWGGTGAMIGSMIAPGIGTAIGAALGGIGGALKGAYDEGLIGGNVNNATGSQVNQDFIARPGAKPIPFSSADTLIGMKKDGGIGKNFVEGNTKKSGSNVVTFGNALRIDGKITVESGNNSKDIDLNNPLIIRALTNLIQQELSKNMNGGKLSSNPI